MAGEKSNDLVFLIKKQFMHCVPINRMDFAVREKNTWCGASLDDQELLVKYTVDCPNIKKYPIKPNYQAVFLKTIISNLEKEKAEIHDCLYDALGQVMALPVPTIEFHYRHFPFENSKPIIIKESVNIISGGTTGLRIWEASTILSEWCVANKAKLRGKKILELGSGLGLTGITISRFCNPSRLQLSDCHPQVLNLLCDNVKLNLLESSSNLLLFDYESELDTNKPNVIQSFRNNSETLQILKLFWEEIDEKFCNNNQIDILLAADVVYDSELFNPLIKAVKLITQRLGVYAIFSCTERNRETLELFLKTVADNSLSLIQLNIPAQKHFLWSQDVPVKIFCIYHNDKIGDLDQFNTESYPF